MNNVQQELVNALAKIVKNDPVISVEVFESALKITRLSGSTSHEPLPQTSGNEIDYQRIHEMVKPQVDVSQIKQELFESVSRDRKNLDPEMKKQIAEMINDSLTSMAAEFQAEKKKMNIINESTRYRENQLSTLSETVKQLPTHEFVNSTVEEVTKPTREKQILLEKQSRANREVLVEVSSRLNQTYKLALESSRHYQKLEEELQTQQKNLDRAQHAIQEWVKELPTQTRFNQESRATRRKFQNIESRITLDEARRTRDVESLKQTLTEAISAISDKIRTVNDHKSVTVTGINFTENGKVVANFSDGQERDLTEGFLSVIRSQDDDGTVRSALVRPGMGMMGDRGPQGKSAYQVAVDNGFEGDENEWLISLSNGRYRDNHVLVKSVDDLPSPTGGEHVLAENTYYEFNGTITSPNALRYSAGSMIGGIHLGKDIFYYTGTGAALRTTDVDFFAEHIVILAPAGSIFDLQGTITNEFYTFFVGTAGSLTIGEIRGYRVPTIKSCNFEGFTDGGLTFSGTSNKILIDGSPFRNAGPNVRAIRFGDDLVVDYVDITGNYFKDFDTGSYALSVSDTAQIGDYALVRGNIFTGIDSPFLENVSPASLRWDFQANSGIRDSRVIGTFNMSGNEVETVLTQDVWTKMVGTTSASQLERMTMPENNRLQSASTKTELLTITLLSTVRGLQTNQLVEVAIFKNGQIESIPMASTLTGSGSILRADVVVVEDAISLEPGDYVEGYIRNVGSNENVVVRSLQMIATAG